MSSFIYTRKRSLIEESWSKRLNEERTQCGAPTSQTYWCTYIYFVHTEFYTLFVSNQFIINDCLLFAHTLRIIILSSFRLFFFSYSFNNLLLGFQRTYNPLWAVDYNRNLNLCDTLNFASFIQNVLTHIFFIYIYFFFVKVYNNVFIVYRNLRFRNTYGN